MSKKKYNIGRECKNYGKICYEANNCLNCKHREVKKITEKDNTTRYVLRGCKQGLDITDHTHKRECFECFKEGSITCSD